MMDRPPLTILVLLIWIGICGGNAAEIYQAKCRNGLGMQSGSIPDHAISASSSYDESSVGPQNGRIRTEKSGGAWCPRNIISRNVYEWMQIDLGEVKMVTLIETQGRFGNGQGQEYAEAYRLEYRRREGDEEWIRYHDRKGVEVFPGNENTYLEEQREINPPIIARYVRVIPHSLHQRTVCMRVELYGCRWTEGVLSYSMPQGQKRGAEVDLLDFTYDGRADNEFLSGGLGQLVDGEQGHANFRLDPTGVGKKGYEWVGWKNESLNQPPIDILFEFDVVRNFSAVRIHCNNMFTKDVRVPKKAVVSFSVGGKYFRQDDAVTFEYMRDTLIEYARPVIIPVSPHRLGKYVQLRLYFDDRWMMISEVQFESVVATGNFTEETKGDASSFFPDDSSTRFITKDGATSTSGVNNPASPDSESKETKEMDDQYIGIIIGTLAALLVLFIAVFLYLFLRHRKHKYSNANGEKGGNSADQHHVTLNLNDLRAITNGKLSHGNMYNSIATSESVGGAIADNDANDRRMLHHHHQDVDVEDVNENDVMTSSMMVAPSIYKPTPIHAVTGMPLAQSRQLPDLPALKMPDSGAELGYDTTTSREYAVPDVTKSALLAKGYEAGMYHQDDSPPPPPLPPHPRSMITDNMHMQGFSGNSLYAVPNNLDLLWKEPLNVAEFPRDSLEFVEQLGEGQFGEVHLCEAKRMADLLGDDFLLNRTGTMGGAHTGAMVAVKVLRHDADDQARADFHKEVKIMSKLKDPNIVRVLGVCTQEEPMCMIVEYMRFGDLNQFLQAHVSAESTVARNPHIACLSYGCLIYMATQIASGMKYLETLNMVHRDLATRNCLVGANYTIKISDFGMSRSLYSTDYYRIEGKAMLPIRWMAWESVLLGKFSSKSDVWSFAVTLWEILLFAREQPYEQLNDEAVIENCGHYYRNDCRQLVLPQPGCCPKEIYDLMVECWNREETYRPAFREIHMFLQRKNMGYNPREERQLPNGISGMPNIV